MRPIDEAPRGELILLYLPEFDVFASRWWIGRWSFMHNKWVICTPYSLGGKAVIVADTPDPTHFEYLPALAAKEG